MIGLRDSDMIQKRVKPRVNYTILRKGGRHIKSKKRERQRSKREIENDRTERNV